jgi:hypothetical protein
LLIEQGLLPQFIEAKKLRPKAVIHIVIVVRNCVGDVRYLRLQARLAALKKALAQFTKRFCIPFGAMFENALASLEGEIQAGKICLLRFKFIDDSQ